MDLIEVARSRNQYGQRQSLQTVDVPVEKRTKSTVQTGRRNNFKSI